MPQYRKIAIRCDASRDIGSGHVMRCLTIADALVQRGAEVVFICRRFPWNLGELIRERGHELRYLPFDPTVRLGGNQYASWVGKSPEADADETGDAMERGGGLFDILFVDHYGLNADWHRRLRLKARRLVVLDDLHDRALECDLVLNQNFGDRPEEYDGLVLPHTVRLVGANYAPLNRAFRAVREKAIRRRLNLKEPRRLLVALGGIDADNVTKRALDATKLVGRNLEVDIVLSGIATHLEEVRWAAQSFGAQLHINSTRMAEIMEQADIAVGASGVSALERCAVGLPSLFVVAADNQKVAAARLSQSKAGLMLGRSNEVTSDQIATALEDLGTGAGLYQHSVLASAEVCDGGGLDRVLRSIDGLLP